MSSSSDRVIHGQCPVGRLSHREREIVGPVRCLPQAATGADAIQILLILDLELSDHSEICMSDVCLRRGGVSR